MSFCKLVRQYLSAPLTPSSNESKTCYYDGQKLLEGGKAKEDEILKCHKCINENINLPDVRFGWELHEQIRYEILIAFFGNEKQRKYRTVVNGQGITAQYKGKEVIRVLNTNPAEAKMYYAEIYCRDVQLLASNPSLNGEA